MPTVAIYLKDKYYMKLAKMASDSELSVSMFLRNLAIAYVQKYEANQESQDNKQDIGQKTGGD